MQAHSLLRQGHWEGGGAGGKSPLASSNFSGGHRRRKINKWGWDHIHIFVFCIINFFWNRLFLTRIYEYGPPHLSIFRRLWGAVLFSGDIFSFSAKVPKFCMNKVGECALEAIKTFLSGKRQGGGGGERNRGLQESSWWPCTSVCFTPVLVLMSPVAEKPLIGSVLCNICIWY